MIYSATAPCVTLPPTSMWSCKKSEFGQIPRSFSLNSGAIRLKRSKNLSQIGFYPRVPSLDAAHQFTLPSLRSVKSERQLARVIHQGSGVKPDRTNCNLNKWIIVTAVPLKISGRSRGVYPLPGHAVNPSWRLGLDLLSRTVLVVDTHPGSDTGLPSTDRNRSPSIPAPLIIQKKGWLYHTRPHGGVHAGSCNKTLHSHGGPG